MVIKMGVNHSNNKERCFAGHLSLKVLQIKVGGSIKAVRTFIETSSECAMYFDKEAKCVTDTAVANSAIDLDFRLTESWGESKNVQYNKTPALRL